MMRVLHIVADFDQHEGIGRAALEVARRAPNVEAYLLTNQARNRPDGFVRIDEVGGPASFFHLTRRRALARVIDEVRPAIVHVHGGIFTAFLVARLGSASPVVLTVYGWPRPPSLLTVIKHFREVRSSPVLAGRVPVSGLLPTRLVAAVMRGGGVRGVLSTDDTVVARLAPWLDVPVAHVVVGAGTSVERASFHPDPVVVFAGRAETSRGIDTLIDAMDLVVKELPDARAALFLLPAVQLDAIVERARRCRAQVDVSTEPLSDLTGRLAKATVAAFPFKYDYATAIPALSVLESMSVGLPVVGTPVGCVAPIVRHGGNGMIVPRRDPRALADAILTISRDQELWNRLSAGALETANGAWSWDAAAAQTAAVYSAVAA
jgi:glycosyltransferase involved in cell wall biosynthesis